MFLRCPLKTQNEERNTYVNIARPIQIKEIEENTQEIGEEEIRSLIMPTNGRIAKNEGDELKNY